jgi:rhodanese-related sulfurtransferase
MSTKAWMVLPVLLALLAAPGAAPAAKSEAISMDQDTLRGLLGAPDLLILDVRQGGDWDKSDQKIRGAVRQDPQRVEAWGPQLPRDKKIVLYCA